MQSLSLEPVNGRVSTSSDTGSTARSALEYRVGIVYFNTPPEVNVLSTIDLHTRVKYSACTVPDASRKTVSFKLNFESTFQANASSSYSLFWSRDL